MAKPVDNQNDLFSFAFCGKREVFVANYLTNLANLAETEKWSSTDENDLDILFYYIVKTFEIVSKQNKILVSKDEQFAVFNTGLMTENGEDIYCFFDRNIRENDGAQKWHLKCFVKSSDRLMASSEFDCKPPLAKYDDNASDIHFNSDSSIELNADHIFDDKWNDEEPRFPQEITQMGKALAIASIKSAFEITKNKIKRNPRLAVPQYYDGKIMFLLPVKIPVIGDKTITMALAVEKMPNKNYRANTIFDCKTAYKKARLITKPESNWLLE